MKLSVGKILDKLTPITFYGNREVIINEVVPLSDGNTHDNALFWCSDKFREQLKNVQKGTVILSEESYQWMLSNHDSANEFNCIVVDTPRAFFSSVLEHFFYEEKSFGHISPSASIHPSVEFNTNEVNIGENVVIEAGVKLGSQVEIGHNTVILKNCVLGNQVKVGNNTTIGGVGFGYEMDESGDYKAMPHIGNVVLDDQVEIGNGVAIDRAVLGSTHLKENVKVDNLVHISHGVKIGKNSLIIANAMIAGSCEIGENVWVSPSSSIIQKTKIGDNSLIGIGSLVLKNVDDSAVVVGAPARKIKDR